VFAVRVSRGSNCTNRGSAKRRTTMAADLVAKCWPVAAPTVARFSPTLGERALSGQPCLAGGLFTRSLCCETEKDRV
jgi:hypothetical protein